MQELMNHFVPPDEKFGKRNTFFPKIKQSPRRRLTLLKEEVKQT